MVDSEIALALRRANIRTTQSFLQQVSSSGDLYQLSQHTGIKPELLYAIALQADLFRVNGIGTEYAELLTAIGCESIRSLRAHKPHTLMDRIKRFNPEVKLVRRMPTLEMIQSWVEQAKKLELVI